MDLHLPKFCRFSSVQRFHHKVVPIVKYQHPSKKIYISKTIVDLLIPFQRETSPLVRKKNIYIHYIAYEKTMVSGTSIRLGRASARCRGTGVEHPKHPPGRSRRLPGCQRAKSMKLKQIKPSWRFHAALEIRVCTYVHMHMYIYMYIYVCVYIYTHVYIHIYVYIYVYVCVSISLSISIDIQIDR